MLIWITLKSALKSLIANKLRSILAMLGIIIGVGAVIAMLAIGNGAQKQVLGQITTMGTNLLVVRPGQRGTGGVISGTQQNLTVEDAQSLRDIEGIEAVSPVVGGSAQVKYLATNTRSNVQGVAPTYFKIRSFELDRGRFFSESEAENMGRVAVIGPVTEQTLFAGGDGVGETVKLEGINFLVIGVLKSKGDQGFFNPDDQVLIPYTTAMKNVFGLTFLREIDIQGTDDKALAKIETAVSEILRKRHRQKPDDQDDFQIRNQAEIMEAASTAIMTFTILLGSVAGISLLVGGIGIMNIMLVTVTERTREIGVRKAIGAKNRDILRQFLIESIIMTGLGGSIGALGGVGAAMLVRTLTSFPAMVTMSSVFLALGFSAAVGVFFGFYPAYRAAQLDPIEALRYE